MCTSLSSHEVGWQNLNFFLIATGILTLFVSLKILFTFLREFLLGSLQFPSPSAPQTKQQLICTRQSRIFRRHWHFGRTRQNNTRHGGKVVKNLEFFADHFAGLPVQAWAEHFMTLRTACGTAVPSKYDLKKKNTGFAKIRYEPKGGDESSSEFVEITCPRGGETCTYGCAED